MPDILHAFLIRAPAARVFQAVSTPAQLDQWWTKRCAGEPTLGAEYELWFGPQFDWRTRVARCVPAEAFEFEIVRAAEDWTGTRVGFQLASADGATQVRFTTWAGPNSMSTIAFPAAAGRCICGCSSGTWSTVSPCPTRSA